VFTDRIGRITERLVGAVPNPRNLFFDSRDAVDRTLFLTGQIAARQLREVSRLGTLADAEFRVTSQYGDDGIIEWIVQRLPGIHPSFVEFGVETFAEANMRFLLRNRNWRGLVMDGSRAAMQLLRSQTIHWMHDLVAVDAFVTVENINYLIVDNGFGGELGVLSIDIDGNDYWVLDAISCVHPAVIVAEINGAFGDLHAVTVPYDPAFERMTQHHSGQYFGASVRAMIDLCADKGYTFLGTNSAGVNAFFVRNDVAAPLVEAIDEIRAWPSQHRDSRDAMGQLTYERGLARTALIEHLPVVDVGSGETRTLADLAPLHSEQWRRAL
jgi:hypothetical protein